MLILDLDNTIFNTESINPKIFESALQVVKAYFSFIKKEKLGNKVVEELWTKPPDIVFKQYNLPEEVKKQFHIFLNKTTYNLKINTFPDYQFLNSIEIDKVLVTTGYTKLQVAKIDALKIKSDFKDIIIDDPFSENRKYKVGIFRDLLENSKLKANDFWVIGDSAENEIKAGKELGMKTIQRIRKGISKSPLSDYVIESFVELNKIIK